MSAVGPVAVPLCVEDSFFSYASGVYKLPSCCTQLMHAGELEIELKIN